MPAGCPHYHRRLIAQDDILEFAECLDCGEILENQPTTCDAVKKEPDTESLSDA